MERRRENIKETNLFGRNQELEKNMTNYKLIIRDCIYGELVKKNLLKNLLNMIIKEFGLMDGLKMNKRICLRQKFARKFSEDMLTSRNYKLNSRLRNLSI
ncbi:unnamed protein product [Lasius platythorax]|uniref:Uncharacterized protein n=1 Tax=Lasius platythorax TaxID=488582 RepID=A0AAV2NEB1_9HYME